MGPGGVVLGILLSTAGGTGTAPPPLDLAALPAILPITPISGDGAVAPVEPSSTPVVSIPQAAITTSPPIDAEPASPPSQDIVVTARKGHAPGDPLEKLNAKSFALTQSVDGALVAPVSRVYEHSLPRPARDGLRNFLENLHEPVVFVNFLIQLKPGKAAETAARFAIDTTLGVAGVFDIAKRRPFNLPLRHNGFADSLGFYGVKPGPFLFLPLIGPTTVRDLAGGMVDRLLLPMTIGAPFNKLAVTVPIGVVSELDRRAQLDEKLQAVRAADDPYATRRAFFLCQRKLEIDHLRGKSSAQMRQKDTEPDLPPATCASAPVNDVADPTPSLSKIHID